MKEFWNLLVSQVNGDFSPRRSDVSNEKRRIISVFPRKVAYELCINIYKWNEIFKNFNVSVIKNKVSNNNYAVTNHLNNSI